MALCHNPFCTIQIPNSNATNLIYYTPMFCCLSTPSYLEPLSFRIRHIKIHVSNVAKTR
uniref:Uncharacterized protein n=1 Tax=Rhizophora mucronata TaxID=61149 RepID=A0A2P2MXZ6_RHIMU